MKPSTRVVFNTAILYGRIVLVALISLYSVRLILSALGVEDYGIYNLVAGVIAMLSFLTSAMGGSTQRYMSFYQGRCDQTMQRKVFCNSLFLHLVLGVAAVIAMEIAGFFLFDGFLNIAPERIPAAKTVYHVLAATILFSIINAPFIALVIAHENMVVNAAVAIFEALCRLGVAVSLFYAWGDKLVAYGAMMGAISFIIMLIYAGYCMRHYPDECSLRIRGHLERPLLREMGSFIGWGMFNTVSGLARSQGMALILNLFHGAKINAAYGVSNQVSVQMGSFSSTMSFALNPQIMKSEGGDDRARTLRLAMMNTKFGFFLLAVLAIPCMFEMGSILALWLKEVPEYTTVFCQLNLGISLTVMTTMGMQSAIVATGRVRDFNLVNGLLILASLPLSYWMLAHGYEPYMVFVGFIGLEILVRIYSLFYLHKYLEMSLAVFFRRVLLCEVVPVVVSVALCLLVVHFCHGAWRFLATFAISGLGFAGAVWFTGLCSDEKKMVEELIGKLIKRKK